MADAAALGCAVCRRLEYGETPAQLHHPRTGTGAGRRAPHSEVIPLCEPHHTGRWGLHAMGRKRWEAVFGVTEGELTAETKRLVSAMRGRRVGYASQPVQPKAQQSASDARMATDSPTTTVSASL